MKASRWADAELQLLSHPAGYSAVEELQEAEKAYAAAGPDELAEASLALAEARLSTAGPGKDFREALSQALEAGHGKLEARLLRLQARAEFARQRPEQALGFARRMLEVDLPDELRWVAHGFVSIGLRRMGGFNEALAAAQQLVDEGKGTEGTKGSKAEAIGRLLSASAWLSPLPTGPHPPRPLVLVHALEQSREGASAELAEAAAKDCLEASRALGLGPLQAAALERFVESLLRQGRFEEARRLAEEEVRSARKARSRSEAGALAALASAVSAASDTGADPNKARTSLLQVLGRLRTLGREGEAAQIQVSLMAAQPPFLDSSDSTSLDTAAAHAQRALRLAQQHGDFAAEAAALRLLTSLHRQMGLEPPSSDLRSEMLSELGAAVQEADQAQDAALAENALRTLKECGREVEAFLSAADLKEVLEPIRSWMPQELVPAMLRAENGSEGKQGGGGSLLMVEVSHTPMYHSVAAGGIQYGPRYRQVWGYRPPRLALASAGKDQPAVVAALRTSSDAEEWEARAWDWTPPLVDAAAHSSFLFAQ